VVRTDSVNVVFTTADDTLAAVHVASAIGKALAAPLTVIHFSPVSSPTESFIERVRAEGIEARVRVYLCGLDDQVLPNALRPHSFIVIGGRRSWWPTAAERLRRRLEAAGHFVLFVDASKPRESARA
jgi:hypothetical protein